jgi:hypothetical protein
LWKKFLPAMNVFANVKELDEYLTRIQKPYVSVDTAKHGGFFLSGPTMAASGLCGNG